MAFLELFYSFVIRQRLHCMQFLIPINNALFRCFTRLYNKVRAVGGHVSFDVCLVF